MEQSSATPEPSAGVVRVQREHSKWQDRARSYQVIFDGDVVGEIANGTTQEFTLAAGSHTLVLKIDWVGSPTESFTLLPGQVIGFTCRAGARAGLQVWATLIRSIWDRESRIRLERTPGAHRCRYGRSKSLVGLLVAAVTEGAAAVVRLCTGRRCRSLRGAGREGGTGCLC